MTTKKTTKSLTELTVTIVDQDTNSQREVKIDLNNYAPKEVRASFEVAGKVMEYIPNNIVNQIINHFIQYKKEFQFEELVRKAELKERVKIDVKQYDWKTKKEKIVTYDTYIFDTYVKVKLMWIEQEFSAPIAVPTKSLVTSKWTSFLAQAVALRQVLKSYFKFFQIDKEFEESEENIETTKQAEVVRNKTNEDKNEVVQLLKAYAENEGLDYETYFVKMWKVEWWIEKFLANKDDKDIPKAIQALKTNLTKAKEDKSINIKQETFDKIIKVLDNVYKVYTA